MKGNAIEFSVVGPGRVGSSVGLALTAAGWRCGSILAGPASHSQQRTLSKAFPGTKIVFQPDELSDDSKLILITVKDDQIRPVASKLSLVRAIDWEDKVVLHFSGVTELNALSNLRRRGAATGALHPVSPFASRYSPAFARSIYYDFLGSPEAFRMSKVITRTLTSKLILLHSERERILLHVASVIASNSSVIAARAAEKMISGFIGTADSRRLLGTLLESTIDNIRSRDGMDALTGPLARGDMEVIRKHVRALKGNTAMLEFYKASALMGIQELLRGELKKQRRNSLMSIKKLLETE